MPSASRRDLVNLLSQLSFSRGKNLVELFLSYCHSVFYKKDWMWGIPWSVTIEPNNTCNLSCPECPSGSGKLTRAKGYLSSENFKAILANLPGEVFYINLYFQGEPLLNPDLVEMIGLAKERKCYVSLSTNGHYLSEELVIQLVKSKLNRLIISLDGIDQSSYEVYRKGGNFQQVISGIKNVIELRARLKSATPFVILQCLWLKSTENKENQLLELSRSLRADKLEFKTAQFYSLSGDKLLIPEKASKRRYKKLPSGEYLIDNKLKNRCFMMWSSCVVTWDGKVIPCCYDKNADYILGDLMKEPLRKIWKGSKYIAFRKMVLRNRKEIPMCRNCCQGSR